MRGCGVGRSEKTGRQRRIINEMTVHSKGVTRRCRFPKQESRCSFEKCNLTLVFFTQDEVLYDANLRNLQILSEATQRLPDALKRIWPAMGKGVRDGTI